MRAVGTSSPAARKAVLLRWADLIRAHADELAVLGVRDNGTAFSMAFKAEAGSAAATIRYYAEAIDKLYGEIAAESAAEYGAARGLPEIDYDQVESLAAEHRPRLIFCGHSAYPRIVDFPKFAEIAREVGAILVADIAHISGLVAGGSHPSPAGHAEVISITTPSSPVLLGTCPTPGTARCVEVSGNYAYVADGVSGLQVIDISTPSAPLARASMTNCGSTRPEHISRMIRVFAA